jgi:carbon monoxide dehydrogenase subunit G
VKIEDQFRVAVPVEEAWPVLLDVERIAPCMPGAQLQEIEGDEYRGIVKVKVGPITAQYKGAARITDTDEANHTVVIKAEGRDTRGQGNASATVTAVLEADGTGTIVKIDTDLNVTGKVAQFGRGVMADVSSKLLGQFAECLQNKVLAGASPEVNPTAAEGAAATATIEGSSDVSDDPTNDSAATGASTATSTSTGGVRTIDSPEAQPVDLLDASSGALIKRVVPIVGALIALLAIRSIFKRRKKRTHHRHAH